jgi:protein-disulfide isomerase
MANSFSFRRWALRLAPLLILVVAVGAWFAFDPGFHSHSATDAAPSSAPANEFDKRIEAYLLNHPEVIIEAVNRYQSRQAAQQESEAQTILKSRAEEVFRDQNSPVAGNPTGSATLVEFFDYNCPYCRRMAPIMEKLIKSDPQLRVVYKEFPILGPNSVFAAKAALAAHEQGKYVAFHDELFRLHGVAEPASVMQVAAKVGLDTDRLKADMKKPEIQTAIEKNLALAEALRINGTPGFVIGSHILRGATDLKALEELVQELRKKHQ